MYKLQTTAVEKKLNHRKTSMISGRKFFLTSIVAHLLFVRTCIFILCRQIQMQALAQLQLQEQEGFKTLDPVQQQHLNLQILQSHPLLLHQVQQLQQAQQLQVSQGQPQATIPVQPISQHVHSQQ